MNVFIFPTDDRLGQASLIDHYNRVGHQVYLPKRGTLGLNWPRISTWPSLLCLNAEGTCRNVEQHPFSEHDSSVFGEDHFLNSFINQLSRSDLKNIPVCHIVDQAQLSNIRIDAYHTLRGADKYLSSYREIARTFFPNAKWISSTLSAFNHNPSDVQPDSLAKIVPANYSDIKKGINIFCTDVEFSLLEIKKRNPYDRNSRVSSFNHNYHVRQPEDFLLFTQMNQELKRIGEDPVLNYGGNIRAMGADIRYSGSGPTGNYTTLSPPECIEEIRGLSGIVHFKSTDWGGGVFFHALHTSTPMITTKKYINASNSRQYLIHGYNCLIVENHIEAAQAVMMLKHQEDLRNRLIDGMGEMKKSIFNDEYWNAWESFIKS